jgi:carboxypeptidase C (cathepsin A)
LARYTGLSKNFIRNSHLRIPRDRFLRELLRDEQLRIGVMDSRITGSYKVDTFLEDPSVFKATGAMVAIWNDYVRKELKYDQDIPYEFLSTKANESWNWGSAAQGYVDVAEILGKALRANRSMRVMIGSGYYDLDTSYFAAEYAANHLGLGPRLREHITLTFYEAGHQMYTHHPSLVKLKADVAAFMKKSLARNPGASGKGMQNKG